MTPISTHEQLLCAATEYVSEFGILSLSQGQFSMEEVCQRAGLSRSTAYRLWNNRQLFIADVVARLGELPTPVRTAGGSHHEIIAAHLHSLDQPGGARALVTEVLRRVVAQEWEFAQTCSVPLAFAVLGEQSRSLDRTNLDAWHARIAEVAEHLSLICGCDWMTPHSSDTFAQAAAAVLLGQASIARATRTESSLDAEALATVLSGIFWEWSEQAPDYDSRQALARYLVSLSRQQQG